MSIKTFVAAAAALAAVALPGAASAQRYGYDYRDGPGRYERAYDGRHDGRDYRRQRWEDHRRWREIQRRRAWEMRHRYDRHQRYDDRYYRY